VLHVTNGDEVIERFRDGGIPGSYLPWRDPLHDGPVPQLPSIEALSDVRARVLSEGGNDRADMRASFAERDRTLGDFRAHDETVLWFEHDLYDQLQLVQLLDWFSRENRDGTQISVIQIGSHPDVTPFYGLGQLTGRQLADLLPLRQPVTPEQYAIGRQAWTAFCAPDPTALVDVANRSFEAMPFLSAALQRCLEEYPSAADGLSRTERQLLEAGASGSRRRTDYYLGSSRKEACPWGDLSVYQRLDALAAGPAPALDRLGADEFAPNDRGRQLLAGDGDWWDVRGGGDVWIGGVHLAGRRPQWRWDAARRTLVTDAGAGYFEN
jgi:hypothetical protein